MFELEPAITDWRRSLAAAITGRDLDELESHLRDSLSRLRQFGLSDEESFLLAARRLGHPANLRLEYAKEHPAALWRDRLLWMLAGVLAFNVAGATAHLVAEMGCVTGAVIGLHGYPLSVVAGTGTLLGCAMAIALAIYAWRSARRGHNFGTTLWISSAIGFLLLCRLISYLGRAGAAMYLTPTDVGHISITNTLVAIAGALLVPLALGIALLRFRRPLEC